MVLTFTPTAIRVAYCCPDCRSVVDKSFKRGLVRQYVAPQCNCGWQPVPLRLPLQGAR